MMLPNLILVFLLQLLIAKPSPITEVQSILSQAFTHAGMSYYLDYPPASKMPFFLRFEKPPVYNGTALPISILNVPYRKGKFVKHDTKLGNDKNRVVIIVEAITVDRVHATVKLWIPYNGVTGNFSLRRLKNSWIILEAEVGQI